MIVAIGFVAILAACETSSSTENNKPPVAMKVKRGVASDSLFGTRIHTVRTIAKDANGKRTKVENAICTLRSKELHGQVQTSDRIAVPQFLQADRFPRRGQPGDLTVTCTAGNLKGARTFEPLVGGSRFRSPGNYDPNSQVNVTFVASPLSPVRSSYPWSYPTTLEVPLQ